MCHSFSSSRTHPIASRNHARDGGGHHSQPSRPFLEDSDDDDSLLNLNNDTSSSHPDHSLFASNDVMAVELSTPCESDDIDGLDCFDLEFEEAQLKVREFPEALTLKPHGVGGVHGGYVIVALYQINDGSDLDGCLRVQPLRTEKEVTGGQCHTPFFKQIFQKNKCADQRQLASIPSLVQSVLCPSAYLGDSSNETLRSLKRNVKLLNHVVQNAVNAIDVADGSNTARLEMMHVSTLSQEQPDIVFPFFDIFGFAYTSDNNNFFDAFKSILIEVIDPLYHVFVENDTADYHCLSPEAKGMLVLISELAVTMIEISPFRGKAMSRLVNFYKQNLGFLFHAPEDVTTVLEGTDLEFTRLKLGLNRCVLAFPSVSLDDDLRITEDDQVIKLPCYIQMLSEQPFVKKLKCGAQFLKSMGMFASAVHEALWQEANSDLSEDQQQARVEASIFEEPNPILVSRIRPEISGKLLLSMAKILARLCDLEWCIEIKDKSFKKISAANRRVPRANRQAYPTFPPAHEFPTTVSGLNHHFVSRGVAVDAQSLSMSTVTDSGESLKTIFICFAKFLVSQTRNIAQILMFNFCHHRFDGQKYVLFLGRRCFFKWFLGEITFNKTRPTICHIFEASVITCD